MKGQSSICIFKETTKLWIRSYVPLPAGLKIVTIKAYMMRCSETGWKDAKLSEKFQLEPNLLEMAIRKLDREKLSSTSSPCSGATSKS